MEWLINNRYLPAQLLLYFLFSITLSGISSAVLAAGSPVLLTFDAEDDRDAVAIRELNLSEPVSYFFTGQFVEEHRKLVAELSRTHTIGSHSYGHAHLKELDAIELRKELLLGKMVLEEVTGKAPVWFRAPFLEYNEDIMKMLKELGFLYDSSDLERWTQQTVLFELPISTRDGSDDLASDYDLFTAGEQSDAEALAWLKSLYDERAVTGRPLVFLMHPRIIAPHKQVLFDFMEYVRKNNGTFMSADQWMTHSFAARPRQSGTWVDLSLGSHDQTQIVEDVVNAGMTDVYLMARDPEGRDFFRTNPNAPGDEPDRFGEISQALKQAGVRVHAWLPVYRNPVLAQLHPDWAMKASNGAVSLEWLSPSNPEVRYSLRETVKLLLRNYDIDGIHLDYFRYPDLAHDFSEPAVTAFKKSQNLQEVTTDQLLNDLYASWTNWRAGQIAAAAGEIREIVLAYGGAEITLSAALIADSALYYRAHEKFGQDYSQLAAQLDIAIPMAYFKEERKPVTWVAQVIAMSRYRLGTKPLLVGIPAYQQPGAWTQGKQDLAEGVAIAREGSDGVVVYPYLYLFGHGDPAWNMPQGSAALLRGITDFDTPRKAVSEPVQSGQSPAGTLPQRATPWLFALSAMATLIVLMLVGIKLWQKRLIGRRGSHVANSLLPNDSQSTSLDWRVLAREIEKEHINAEIFSQVSNLLHATGAANIASFRLAQVLDEVSDAPQEISDVVLATSGLDILEARGLRFIEESVLLGYTEIKDHKIHITPRGIGHLKHSQKKGYNRAYSDFLEARLSETIVLSCPRCDSLTLGHWFWKSFHCGGCHRDFEFTEAPVMFREGKEIAAVIHAIHNGSKAGTDTSDNVEELSARARADVGE